MADKKLKLCPVGIQTFSMRTAYGKGGHKLRQRKKNHRRLENYAVYTGKSGIISNNQG